MAYWLMKSEPDVFSFWDLQKKPAEQWHGVRNFTARNNMMKMQIGEQAFFYHSNIGKEIVGIMKVVALAHPDSTAEPNEKGAGYEFIDKIVGGTIPREYIKPIDQGIREAMDSTCTRTVLSSAGVRGVETGSVPERVSRK